MPAPIAAPRRPLPSLLNRDLIRSRGGLDFVRKRRCGFQGAILWTLPLRASMAALKSEFLRETAQDPQGDGSRFSGRRLKILRETAQDPQGTGSRSSGWYRESEWFKTPMVSERAAQGSIPRGRVAQERSDLSIFSFCDAASLFQPSSSAAKRSREASADRDGRPRHDWPHIVIVALMTSRLECVTRNQR